MLDLPFSQRILTLTLLLAIIGGVGTYVVLAEGWTHRRLPVFTPQTGRRLMTVWIIHWCTYVGGGKELCFCVRDRTFRAP